MSYPESTPFEAFSSQNITAGSASAATSLGGAGVFRGPHPRSVRIVVGADAVRVAFGDSTVEATASSMLVSSGVTEVFTVAPSVTHIALLRNAGVDSICNVTTGRGV